MHSGSVLYIYKDSRTGLQTVEYIDTGLYITFPFGGAMSLSEVVNMAILQLFTLGGSGTLETILVYT